MSDDIFAEDDEQNSEADLNALMRLAEEATEIDATVAELEENAKALRAQSDEIKKVKIPDMLSDLRMSGFSMEDGTEITVSDFVHGNLPKSPEKFAVAKDYLISIGGEALLKTEVSLKFGKDDRQEAVACISSLESSGYEPVTSEGVHHATLGKFIRELMDAGETVDTVTLGLYTGRIAKFKKG